MPSASALKSQVIAVFRPAPDFSALDSIRRTTRSRQRALLRWLDESGLALYFLDRIEQHKATDRLPAQFREALVQRQQSNYPRTADLLVEFRRIVTTFAIGDQPVAFCALKGFSLVPDFCPAPHLRHQTDFDFLLAPESFSQAAGVLESLGYTQTEVRSTGQVSFSTPLRHIPSAADDIYAVQRHREVDLLPSFHLDFRGVSLSMPADQLARSQRAVLNDFSFPALAPADAFSLQVLHTFSHLLGSWIRLAWLVEIAHFLQLHHDNASIWQSVIERNTAIRARTLDADNSRRAFGLILSLTNHLFATPIPALIADWCVVPESLPAPIDAWVSQFGSRFAQADLNGSKLTLFVHSRFVQDRPAWRSYLLSRLFPFGRTSSIGSVSIASPGAKIKAQVSQWLHSMRRVLFHARELVSLPVEFIRWKRALNAARRQRALMPRRSTSQRNSTPSGAAMANLARLPD